MMPLDTEPRVSPLEPLRQIAILLRSLPDRTHRVLLGQLSSDDKQKVLEELDELGNVDLMEQFRVLSVMRDQLQAETVVVEKIESEIQDEIVIGRARLSKKPTVSLHRTVATHPSTSSSETGSSGDDVHGSANASTSTPLQFLSHLEPDDVLRLFEEASPRTIAVCLSSIDAQTATQLFARLDAPIRSETAQQLSELDQISVDTQQDIASEMRNRLESLRSNQAQMTNESFERYAQRFASGAPLEVGPRIGADATSGRISTHHSSQHPPATSIRKSDEDEALRHAESVDRILVALRPRDLCRALGMVTTDQAFLTLCGLPNETTETVLALLPRRKSRKVRADMRRLGTVQLADIDAAKFAVAEVALRLTVAPQRMVA